MTDYILLPGYASPKNLWHKNAKLLLGKKVVVEEKIDGSQFSFGRMVDGHFHCRSKGRQVSLESPDPLFAPVVSALQKIADDLPTDHIFRAEAVTKLRHNLLRYERVPRHCCVVYDIQDEFGWLSPAEKSSVCASLGLECVGFEVVEKLDDYDSLKELLELPSMLGGKREGIVIKPLDYTPLDPYTNMPVMAKMVRNEFREKHKAAGNPNGTESSKSVIQKLVETFSTEARWQKAVQHLRDAGELKNEMADVRALMLEVVNDVGKEEKEYICEVLWKWAWPQIKRQVARGLPEWYKEQLMSK